MKQGTRLETRARASVGDGVEPAQLVPFVHSLHADGLKLAADGRADHGLALLQQAIALSGRVLSAQAESGDGDAGVQLSTITALHSDAGDLLGRLGRHAEALTQLSLALTALYGEEMADLVVKGKAEVEDDAGKALVEKLKREAEGERHAAATKLQMGARRASLRSPRGDDSPFAPSAQEVERANRLVGLLEQAALIVNDDPAVWSAVDPRRAWALRGLCVRLSEGVAAATSLALSPAAGATSPGGGEMRHRLEATARREMVGFVYVYEEDGPWHLSFTKCYCHVDAGALYVLRVSTVSGEMSGTPSRYELASVNVAIADADKYEFELRCDADDGAAPRVLLCRVDTWVALHKWVHGLQLLTQAARAAR